MDVSVPGAKRRVEEGEGRDDQVGSWARPEFEAMVRRGERERDWNVDSASGSDRGNGKATVRGELGARVRSWRYWSFGSWRMGAMRIAKIPSRSVWMNWCASRFEAFP